ncbi:hypothetical protein D3D01_21405 [Haloarcula sp. Atlit-7R]|nr:hypothetical protein D3D01_21405 [Haloarcula sp. Atlit-7R]
MSYFWRRILTTACGEKLETDLFASLSEQSFKSHDVTRFGGDKFTTDNRFTASDFGVKFGIKLL